MEKILIDGDHKKIISALFNLDENGHIKFGWTSRSVNSGSLDSLMTKSQIKFRDYIMEGTVMYFLNIQIIDTGLILFIKKNGTNRDDYILPQIRHYINESGFNIRKEETV